MDITQGVIDFFYCLVRFGVGLITWSLVEAFNEIMLIMGWFLAVAGLIIPSLNFEVPEIPDKYLGYINWIFPLGFLVPLYTYALAAGAIYRVVRWLSKKARTPVQPKLPGF